MAALVVRDEVWRRWPLFSISRIARFVQPRAISVHRRNFYWKCAGKLVAWASDKCAPPDRQHDAEFSNLDDQPLRAARMAAAAEYIRERGVALRLPDAISRSKQSG